MRILREWSELAALAAGIILVGVSHLFRPVVAALVGCAAGVLCAYALVLARQRGWREALEELTGKVLLFSASLQPVETPEQLAKDEEVAN